MRSPLLMIAALFLFNLNLPPKAFGTDSDIPVLSQTGLPVLDVSGKNGRSGSNGRSYFTSAWHGENGRDGGNAGPAQDGQDAGELTVKLGTPRSGILSIEGQAVAADGGSHSIQTEVRLGDFGTIRLQARGGNGGNGGIGGRGEGGGDGRSGRDATRWSTGRNGENGGNGGDGGNGTSGGNGGSGGKVLVQVKQSETSLLMLVKADVQGGAGGAAGLNGSGGFGGMGGRGGSSYHWTTTRYFYNGRTMIPITDHHYSPGGSSGRDGYSGRSGQGDVHAGDSGPDGVNQIQVVDQDGAIHTYSSVYNLELVGFQIKDSNQNKIVEPGEKITVHQIRVKNTGGMPTPGDQQIAVFLQSRGLLLSEGEPLKIEKSLQPGEEYELPGSMTFQIQEVLIQNPGDRWITEEEIRPTAVVSEVNRPFEDFSNHGKKVTITFPVEITPIAEGRPIGLPDSLSPGEPVQIIWKVTNVSGKDFGGDSELRRIIATQLKVVGGEISPDLIRFKDATGQEVSLDPNGDHEGFVSRIAKLRAGESTLIEGTLELLPGVSYYSKAKLETSLHLGRFDLPDQTWLTQFYQPVITAALKYRKSKDSRILLVANYRTSHEELVGFQRLAAQLGVGLDVWDISYYGYIDMAKELDQGSNLFRDWKDSLIVFLNEDIRVEEKVKQPIALLEKEQFMRAAMEYGIHVLVLGQTRDSEGRPVFDPFSVPAGVAQLQKYNSVGEAVLARYQNKAVGPSESDAVLGYDQVAVNHWQWSSQVKEDVFLKKVRRFADRLTYLRPDQRYFLTYDFHPEMKEKRWFGKKWEYGQIQVRRGLDGGLGSGIAIETNLDRLHQGEVWENEAVQLGMILALSFDQKLTLLQRIFREDHANSSPTVYPPYFKKELIGALLAELALEQEALFRSKYREGLSQADLGAKLPKLKQIADFPWDPITSLNIEEAEVLTDLMGMLRYLTQVQVSIWQKFANFFTGDRIGPPLAKQTLKLLDYWCSRLFPEHLSRAGRKMVQVSSKRFKAQVKKALKDHTVEARTQGGAALEKCKAVFSKVQGISGTHHCYVHANERVTPRK